ncbi:MAG: SDR family NAD(P)-dependent oxidoreductase [Chloroflexota bacterium]
MPLADRVVLITGATGGLGRAVIRQFADAGSRLGLAGTNEERLRAAAAEAGLTDERWAPGVGDLTDRAAAEAAVAAVVDRLGGIDVLLHLVGGHAGGGSIASFADEAAAITGARIAMDGRT